MNQCRTIPAVILMALSLLDFASSAQARRAIPEDNLSYPIRITHSDGSASGFYLNTEKYTYLITAGHVLSSIRKTANLISYASGQNKRTIIEIDIVALTAAKEIRIHKNKDVAMIRIAKKSKEGKLRVSKGVVIQESSGLILGVNYPVSIKTYDKVIVGNDVYIFGYPSSIGIKEIPQFDYESPLLRKGIIAGKDTSESTIIIDCPTYYGNSGGPVVEIEEKGLGKNFMIVGVVSEFIPFKEDWINVTHRYKQMSISNSGYSVVVPMDAVIELLHEFPDEGESKN